VTRTGGSKWILNGVVQGNEVSALIEDHLKDGSEWPKGMLFGWGGEVRLFVREM